MLALAPIIILILSGIVGAGIAGNLVPAAAIPVPAKLVAGSLGGLLGGLALAWLATGSTGLIIDEVAAAATGTGVDFTLLLSRVGGGLLGGGLATLMLGALTGRGGRR